MEMPIRHKAVSGDVNFSKADRAASMCAAHATTSCIVVWMLTRTVSLQRAQWQSQIGKAASVAAKAGANSGRWLRG
jgi:hypothetical protein